MKYFLLTIILFVTACSTAPKKTSGLDYDTYKALCYEADHEVFKYYQDVKMSVGDQVHFSIVKDETDCIFEAKEKSEFTGDNKVSFLCYLDPYYQFVLGGEDFSVVKQIGKEQVQVYNNETHKMLIMSSNNCQFIDSTK